MFLLICFVIEDMGIMKAMSLVLLNLNYIRPYPSIQIHVKFTTKSLWLKVVESSIVKEMAKQFKIYSNKILMKLEKSKLQV